MKLIHFSTSAFSLSLALFSLLSTAAPVKNAVAPKDLSPSPSGRKESTPMVPIQEDEVLDKIPLSHMMGSLERYSIRAQELYKQAIGATSSKSTKSSIKSPLISFMDRLRINKEHEKVRNIEHAWSSQLMSLIERKSKAPVLNYVDELTNTWDDVKRDLFVFEGLDPRAIKGHEALLSNLLGLVNDFVDCSKVTRQYIKSLLYSQKAAAPSDQELANLKKLTDGLKGYQERIREVVAGLNQCDVLLARLTRLEKQSLIHETEESNINVTKSANCALDECIAGQLANHSFTRHFVTRINHPPRTGMHISVLMTPLLLSSTALSVSPQRYRWDAPKLTPIDEHMPLEHVSLDSFMASPESNRSRIISIYSKTRAEFVADSFAKKDKNPIMAHLQSDLIDPRIVKLFNRVGSATAISVIKWSKTKYPEKALKYIAPAKQVLLALSSALTAIKTDILYLESLESLSKSSQSDLQSSQSFNELSDQLDTFLVATSQTLQSVQQRLFKNYQKIKDSDLEESDFYVKSSESVVHHINRLAQRVFKFVATVQYWSIAYPHS